MFRRFASYFSLLLLLLLVPGLACAQDEASPSMAEKYAGFYISLDVLAGTSYSCTGDYCDDPQGTNYDNYVLEHGLDKTHQQYILDERVGFGFGILGNLSGGYLFDTGTRLFVGPEITVSTGYPMIANLDARARFVIHLKDSHALEASFGVGLTFLDLLYGSSDNILFLPMQVGYNYTFDNGIMLGLSCQLNLSFLEESKFQNIKTTRYYNSYKGEWVEYRSAEDLKKTGTTLAYIPVWGIGVHFGYRFGKID